jgi:hypothetical protein
MKSSRSQQPSQYSHLNQGFVQPHSKLPPHTTNNQTELEHNLGVDEGPRIQPHEEDATLGLDKGPSIHAPATVENKAYISLFQKIINSTF